MNLKLFEKIVKKREDVCKRILLEKRKEYANDNDVLINFNNQALLVGLSRGEALLGNLSKHLISLIDMVHGKLPITDSIINEKFTDIHNYLYLLEAIFIEDLKTPSFLSFKGDIY